MPMTYAVPSSRWSWVTISGRDARDFLHRLTTVNANSLEIGRGSPGCFLTAQGKIRAYFRLWRYGEDDFAAELDAGEDGHWTRDLLAAIDQYTFAEKIQVVDATSGLACRWIFAEASEAPAVLKALGAEALASGQTVAIDEEIRLCHHGERDFGRIWISAWGRPARLAQWLERALPDARSATPHELEPWRIQALRPQVDREITSSTIPLEVGLTEAVAQAKGCYPGQEVIERISALGAPARRLAQIEISGASEAPASGETLLNLAEPPVEVGEITSVAPGDGPGTFLALGFVRKIHAKEGLEIRLSKSSGHGRIARVAPYAY